MVEETEIDRDIDKAEAEYQQDGVLLDAREALSELRGKYFVHTKMQYIMYCISRKGMV